MALRFLFFLFHADGHGQDSGIGTALRRGGGGRKEEQNGTFSALSFFRLFTPPRVFAPSRFPFPVFLGILKRYALCSARDYGDAMDGSATRSTKHDGICRDTRCIIQFSFFSVSVFNLPSTLRCLCSFASFSTSHHAYLPLHQPALVFFHIPCRGAFFFSATARLEWDGILNDVKTVSVLLSSSDRAALGGGIPRGWPKQLGVGPLSHRDG
jgi:hypothetical protein